MMPCSLLVTIKSNNKKSFFYLFLLFTKLFKSLLVNQKKSFKEVFKFTILKSPHVHKSAQHEFKKQTNKKQFIFILFSIKGLITFKKLFNSFFQDISKHYSFFIKTNSLLLSLNFFKLNTIDISHSLKNNGFSVFSVLNQKKDSKTRKLKTYFKILNLIGKIKVKDTDV